MQCDLTDITEILTVPWMSQKGRLILGAFQKVRSCIVSVLENWGKGIPSQVSK